MILLTGSGCRNLLLEAPLCTTFRVGWGLHSSLAYSPERTTMESLHPNQQSVQESDRLGVNTALCVDLWAYGGATGKLREVIWRSEGALADLFAKTVAENEGKFIEANHNKLLLFFENPLRALSAAKSLQLNLLTFDQGPFAGQILPKMAVNGWLAPRRSQPAGEDVPTQVVEPTQPFREEGPA